MGGRRLLPTLILALAPFGLLSVGCQNGIERRSRAGESAVVEVPTERAKASLPRYVIEPPDILLVDLIRAIPKGPYKVQPFDALAVLCPQAFRDEPISSIYQVGPDGRITLGVNYGSVQVADMTLEQVEAAIQKHLSTRLDKPKVVVSLASTGFVQQIRGEHLVRPDGTIGLGKYGSVYVTGLTIDEAKAAIEQHLSGELLRPEVSLDVFSFNSKYYYVIADGGGYGEQIYRLPSTGNETVLDALSLVGGLSPVASKGRVWLARPGLPNAAGADEILPVDYCAITQRGEPSTNYQVLPGDRLYVKAVPLITADTWLARAIHPVERVLGLTLLGATTVQTVTGRNLNGTTTLVR